MIDNKTSYLRLPLPNIENDLSEDVGRISQSFEALDAHAQQTSTTLAAKADTTALVALTQEVATKADSAGVDTLMDRHNKAASAHPNMKTLPDQTGNAGKILTTDGTDPSWSEVPKSDWDSITGKPDTLVLRDADGKITGDILGNAATATTAKYA